MVTSDTLDVYESDTPDSKILCELVRGEVIECLDRKQIPDSPDIRISCSFNGGAQRGWLHRFHGIAPVQWVKLDDAQLPVETQHPRMLEHGYRGGNHAARAVMLYYRRLPLVDKITQRALFVSCACFKR